MGVMLTCDAPGCDRAVAADARQGRLAQPEKWWLQTDSNGRFVIGCCEQHFVEATKQQAS